MALTPEGALGISWIADVGRGREVRLRVVTAEREDLGEFALGPALSELAERGPQLTVGADGSFALATYQGTRPLLRRFGPEIRAVLQAHPDAYAAAIRRHFERHLAPFLAGAAA